MAFDHPKIIHYKGIDILYVNYSSCATIEDQLALMNMAADHFRDQPGAVGYLMGNVTNRPGTKPFLDELKRLGTEVFDKKLKARAVIGTNPIKKLLLTAYNKLMSNAKVAPFDTQEEALEYLYRKSQE